MLAFQTLIVAFAAFASAGKTTGDIIAECSGNGSGNTVQCCNKESGDTGVALLPDVLGGSCSPLNIPVGLIAALAVPITNYCNSQIACCSGDQTGIANIQCLPITI